MDEKLEQETAETILLNRTVVQQIVKNLDTENLLSAGRVNKTWISEARRVLRDERKCVVFISGGNPCSRAAELNDLLGSFSTTVIPFNGISITIDQHECDIHVRDRAIDEIYGNLLQLPFKYVQFEWTSYGKTEKCPLGQVILRFMARSANLEELKIGEIPMNVNLKLENASQEGPPELPKLKILKLPESQLDALLKANFLEVLSDRAPNLKQLESTFLPELIGLLPPNKVHIVKNLWIDTYEYQASGRELRTSTEDFLNNMKILSDSGAKLRKLSAMSPYFIQENNQDMELYRAYLLTIIRRSSNSLRKVMLDALAATMLKSLTIGCPTIPNVTEVRFVMFEGKNTGIARCLHGIRLAEIFPNVTSVLFSPGSGEFTDENSLVGEANNLSYPWPSVEEVDLWEVDLNVQSITEIGALFPNLRELKVQVSYETPGSVPFQETWSSCPALRSLLIRGRLRISFDTNFDAIFCGIYPEEAEMLQEKDEEFLTAVNIVPAFPAINHLRDLKSLKLELELKTDSAPSTKNDKLPQGKIFLSKVAGLTALRRMPDLVLELMAPFEAAEYLDHLKAFVRLDFQPTFNFSTYANLMGSVGSDLFAKINLAFAQHTDEDDDELKGLDFSGRF